MEEENKLKRTQDRIDEIKEAIYVNIEQIIQRGEQLENLEEKSRILETQGSAFRRGAQKVRKKRCRENVQCWLAIGGAAALAIFVLSMILYGILRHS